MKKVASIFSFWFVFAFPVFSQTDTASTLIENRLENLAELGLEEEDLSQLTEILDILRKDPIDLNHAEFEELQQTGLFTDLQIAALLKHRRENGTLISIYELQSINGFDVQFIRNILPYVRVKDRFDATVFKFSEVRKYGRNELTFRMQQILEDQKGFLDTGRSAYLGSPHKLYARYRFTYQQRLSFGITGEKDAGEEFFRGSAKNGFDFYSAHFFIKPGRFVNTLAVGDFHAGFGQGLVMWTGFGTGKSPDPMMVKRTTYGLRPFASASEFGYLRGAAVTLKHKKMELTTLVSSRNVDASIATQDSTGDILELGAIQESGLHTTLSQVDSKNRIRQSVAAAHLQYKSGSFRLGATGSFTQLERPLVKNDELYNFHDFSGKEILNAGFNYSAIVKNLNFFGEQAYSSNGGIATLNGVLISADHRASFSILHRYYSPQYFSFYTAAFSENTKPENEQGIFFGLSAKLHPSLTFNSYFDNYSFKWLKYQVSAPSRGNELFTQLTWTPMKKMEVYARYREKNKEKNFNIEDRIDPVAPSDYKQIRINFSYPATPFIQMKDRVEHVSVKEKDAEKETGLLVSHDIIYKRPGRKLGFAFRYAVFATDSYDSRIYMFETDMPGAFSIPSVYYKGMRTYLLMSYDIMRGVEAWVRISRTVYSNQDVISEGSQNEIQGNHKTELKAQLRFTF